MTEDYSTLYCVFPLLQCVERVARYIDEQNRNVFECKGIVFGDPMDRGLRCVSNVQSSVCVLLLFVCLQLCI